MLRAIDVVRKVARSAKQAYVSAFADGDALLADYGITTPLRLGHFLAQVMHETDGLTIERESGSYSAERLMEIFGVNRHSAAITWPEAQKLARNGPAIFERAYGLGNPRKAEELGNTEPGDGWKYRGNGVLQTTGRGNHRRMGEKCGLGDLFERDPASVTSAQYALLPALAEWRESKCNALADRNDILSITRRINGGTNGLKDRKAWFARIYPLLKGEAAAAWKAATPDETTRMIQEGLRSLGHDIKADGLIGPKTEAAIKAFQSANGLRVDGVAGDITLAAIKARLDADKAEPPIKTELPMPDDNALKSRTMQGAAGAGAGGSVITVDNASEMVTQLEKADGHISAGTIIGLVIGLVIVAGAAYAMYARWDDAGRPIPSWWPKWLGGAA